MSNSKFFAALSSTDFGNRAKQDNHVVIDTRIKTDFTGGFVPGSIFMGLDGQFEKWAAPLVAPHLNILLVAENGKEEESRKRLVDAGWQNVTGYLEGGFPAWAEAGFSIDMLIDVEADELAMDLPFDSNILLIDVRTGEEFDEAHVAGSQHLPLADLTDLALLANISESDNIYLYCGSGYRSVIAASIFKQHALHNVRNVLGGWNAIKEQEKIPQEKLKK